MAGKAGTRVITGKTEIAEAQKPLKLVTIVPEYTAQGIWLSADPSNVGQICAVGSSKTTTEAKLELGKVKGLVLEKKKPPVFVEVSDPGELWGDVQESKDRICWQIVLA